MDLKIKAWINWHFVALQYGGPLTGSELSRVIETHRDLNLQWERREAPPNRFLVLQRLRVMLTAEGKHILLRLEFRCPPQGIATRSREIYCNQLRQARPERF